MGDTSRRSTDLSESPLAAATFAGWDRSVTPSSSAVSSRRRPVVLVAPSSNVCSGRGGGLAESVSSAAGQAGRRRRRPSRRRRRETIPRQWRRQRRRRQSFSSVVVSFAFAAPLCCLRRLLLVFSIATTTTMVLRAGASPASIASVAGVVSRASGRTSVCDAGFVTKRCQGLNLGKWTTSAFCYCTSADLLGVAGDAISKRAAATTMTMAQQRRNNFRTCGDGWATAKTSQMLSRGNMRGLSAAPKFSSAADVHASTGDGDIAPVKKVISEEEKTSSGDRNENVNEVDWREGETYELPSVSVPSKFCHALIAGNKKGDNNSGKGFKEYLASAMAVLDGVHPRVKVVRDMPKGWDGITNNNEASANTDLNAGSCDINMDRKLLLLDPKVSAFTEHSTVSTPTQDQDHGKFRPSAAEPKTEPEQRNGKSRTRNHPETDSRAERDLRQAYPGLPENAIRALAALDATPGPTIRVSIPLAAIPLHRTLSRILPPTAHPPPSAFEHVGHVCHLNLKSNHSPFGNVIGDVILAKFPAVKTVVNKVGEVSGPYRTYSMELLAGKDDTNVSVVEDGVRLNFDLRKVYWCSRLAGERYRMVRDDFREGDVVADAFCGVGALIIEAAIKRGCRIIANDLNPHAVRYAKENAARNGIKKTTFDVSCGDGRDFIMGLGIKAAAVTTAIRGEGEASAEMDDKGIGFGRLPDHLVMNYPLEGPAFLDALRWWPTTATVDTGVVPWVHVYTFARADGHDDVSDEDKDERSSGNTLSSLSSVLRGADSSRDSHIGGSHHNNDGRRDAIEVAVDMIANGLLPEGGASHESRHRRDELNRLGCDVRAREVRDVAPGKVVICVTFRATEKLIRQMQGDFVDF